MGVLVFRHIAMEHLGLIASALDAEDVEYEYADLFSNPSAPVDFHAASGFIFMGGPMSVNDDLPYLRRELGYIEMALVAGKPLLGMCLGAQLLAKSLGAHVYPNPTKEIGWGAVHRTEAGHRDSLLGSFEDPEVVLHWHGETFDLPSGATWLAFSDRCKHQAFRFGSNVYGIQFHLETTPDMIEEWVHAEVNRQDVADLAEPVDAYANQERMRELSSRVFGAWTRLVKNRR